jgi:outer membrane protein assembly factor BamA
LHRATPLTRLLHFACRSDRFFLGGPDSLRGFCTKGAGPTDARRPRGSAADEEEGSGSSGSHITRDAIGGDLLCSASAAVTFQVRAAHLSRMRAPFPCQCARH